MGSVMKKVGSLRLNKDVKVDNVVYFGYPLNLRVSETNSTDSYNSFDIFMDDETKITKKVVKDKAE